MKLKKYLYIFIITVCISCLFISCDDTCGTCRKVTYDSNGAVVKADSYTEYCALELLVIEATSDVTVGGNTTTYECH